MKIVIDIPEDVYKAVCVEAKREVHPHQDYRWIRILRSICDGTPLPKGHGRLIDADKLGACTVYYAPRGFEGLLMRYADLQNAPTIIEADKEE